jgi:hypothetical protein
MFDDVFDGFIILGSFIPLAMLMAGLLMPPGIV